MTKGVYVVSSSSFTPMKKLAFAALGPPFLIALLGPAGCDGQAGRDEDDTPPTPRTVAHDFANGAGTWVGDAADYGVDTAPLDVAVEARPLPAPFTGTGLYLGGTNRSDDLLVYAKDAVTGLQPGRTYRVDLAVTFLTDAPRNCVGVGGSPGESVWLVGGASAIEPTTVFDGIDYRLNVDHGNQATSGKDVVVLGDIAGTNDDCQVRTFEAKHLAIEPPSPVRATADARGTAWLLVGLDSGYEATSAVYLQRVRATFTPEAPPTAVR